MPVNLKITLGVLNYVNWIHVTAAKVSSPNSIAFETWIDTPVTNYNFIIPGLDPEIYYVSYYDAATNTSLGSIVAQLVVDALTGDTLYERRFYTCAGSGAYDPADGATSITDPYLIGKNVTGVFKEGFRYFDPATEFSFDNTTGTIPILNGTSFSANEKFIVEIKYNVASGTPAASGSALYSATINVTEDTRTLLSSEINARIRCVGTSAKQVITACSLASIAVDNGYYFDNSVGGTAVQVKLLFSGTDQLRYNGFMASSDLFAEFWVSKGEHLLIRKFHDSTGDYWEVIGNYKGTNVGEKVTLGYNGHPNTLVEQAQWIDGDEYGRLWWWLNNVLPATHKYSAIETDPVDPNRTGQFAIHPTLKKFRMPFTVYMTERGLHNFLNVGSGDSQRSVPYPGGYQDEQVGQHTHDGLYGDTTGHGGASFPTGGVVQWLVNIGSTLYAQISNGKTGNVTNGDNNEQRLKNVGVIYARRI